MDRRVEERVDIINTTKGIERYESNNRFLLWKINCIFTKMIKMRELYREMMERLEFLESQPQSQIIDGRILELNNCILRVQQMLISDIKK